MNSKNELDKMRKNELDEMRKRMDSQHQFAKMKKQISKIKKRKPTNDLRIKTIREAHLSIYNALLVLENNPGATVDMKAIKEAARALYSVGGDKLLHDDLLWLFIPRGEQRIVDVAFDGVGEWRG